MPACTAVLPAGGRVCVKEEKERRRNGTKEEVTKMRVQCQRAAGHCAKGDKHMESKISQQSPRTKHLIP